MICLNVLTKEVEHMSYDIAFIVATIGMLLGTAGIIILAVGNKRENESIEDVGNSILLFGGLVLLYGLNMK